MEAAEAKIQRILQGDKQFLVPHFQRPYSWREREWRALWNDLVELVGDDDPQPHFLGSIVSAPARAVPEGVEKRLLIDGQQRLTAIVILLAIIRERASAAGNAKLAERVVDLILNRHEEGAERYKLQPTQGETVHDSDRDALKALIDGREHTSTSGIHEARNYFTNKLARADSPSLEALLKVFASLQAPRPRDAFAIAIGRSGYWLSLNANVAHGKLLVKLMMHEEESAALPKFLEDRVAIEQAIGSALEWNPSPEKKFKSIRLTRPTDLADRATCPDGIAWLTKTAVAFKQAFAPRVAALES